MTIPNDRYKRKIAVVGSGVSGLVSAFLLQKEYDVTLFEKSSVLGGHCLTVIAENVQVDLGFQVFNLTTYPNFVGLIDFLRADNGDSVECEESSMSFSCSIRHNDCNQVEFEWASHGIDTVIPNVSSFTDIRRYKLLYSVLKFGREAPSDAQSAQFRQITMGEYATLKKYPSIFVSAYLKPMIAAIWSVPNSKALKMSFVALVNFMTNHHLFSTVWPPRPTWRVLKHRSKSYVKSIADSLNDIRLNCGIDEVVQRNEVGVTLKDCNGIEHQFDKLVLAVHSDQALRILGSFATEQEIEILSSIPYQSNTCVLHTDESFMPSDKKMWASWNSLIIEGQSDSAPLTCTYWLNFLQNLPDSVSQNLFLTLNPSKTPSGVIATYHLEHPVFNAEAVEKQANIKQGISSVYFAGAWTDYGFHEDGMRSAIKVASSMIAEFVVPWHVKSTSPVPSSITAWLGWKIAKVYLRKSITKGELKIILPDGTDMIFGSVTDAYPFKATMRVIDWELFSNILIYGSIGLGMAYFQNQFRVTNKDEAALTDLFAYNLPSTNRERGWLGPILYVSESVLAVNAWYKQRNTKSLSKQNIAAHYDLGNNLYKTFLDEAMVYSSADFGIMSGVAASKFTLEQAQQRKLKSLVEKAGINSTHRVLEIGCGWGALAVCCVQTTGCSYTGITLSKEQKAYCDDLISRLGLSDKIDIRLVDYRVFCEENTAVFDSVLSIEMIEAVGHENLPVYFNCIKNCLKPSEGTALLQAITIPDDKYEDYRRSTDYIREFIFPGGHLPSDKAMSDALSQVNLNSADSKLILKAKRSLRYDYAETLRQWRERFNCNSEYLSSIGYGMEFQRMFNWYFLFCESGFRADCIDVVQLTYDSVEKKDDLIGQGVWSGHVFHYRHVGNRIGFRYPITMASVDLSHVNDFKKLYLSFVPKFLVGLDESDYGKPFSVPLIDQIKELIYQQSKKIPSGTIYMLTTLRGLNFSFNPITIYYAMSSDDRIEFLVLEVTNTPWIERNWYVIEIPQSSKCKSFEKTLHVSPFFGMKYRYTVEVENDQPGKLGFKLDLTTHEGEETHFSASVRLNRHDNLGFSNFFALAVQPWITQFWIHKQAAILYFRGQPVHTVSHENYSTLRNIADIVWHLFVMAVASIVLLFERLFLSSDLGESFRKEANIAASY